MTLDRRRIRRAVRNAKLIGHAIPDGNMTIAIYNLHGWGPPPGQTKFRDVKLCPWLRPCWFETDDEKEIM